MGDRYTKVVLTVIAVTLVWLCLWGPGPPMFGTPAEAQRGGTTANRVDVNITAVGGQRISTVFPAVPVTGLPLQAYPIQVRPVP